MSDNATDTIKAPDVDDIDIAAHADSTVQRSAAWSRWPQSLSQMWPWALACAALPLGLFLLIRPDWFFKSNGLDPYFYTGYAQNLGDVIAISGDRHYFVSRWPHYLPNRLFVKVFGAEAGFLVLRWLFASLIAACVVAIGRRRWRSSTVVALVVFTLISPMLLRAVLNDYIDALTAPLGILAITLVALRPDKKSTAVAVGGCAAAVGIVNPIGAAIIFCIAPAWFLAVKSWRTRLVLVGTLAISAGAVVGFGLLLFRSRFNIPNVYEPTIRFASDNSSYQDPLKSPRLWWMGYRLWIYIPLLVLVTWWYLVKHRAIVFDKVEKTILLTCAVQYGFQVWYQFSRHGSTLEIPYYWSMMVPSETLAMVVILGTVSHLADWRVLPAAVGLLVAVATLSSTATPEVYSSWLDALIVILVVAFTWHHLGSRLGEFGVGAIVFVVFTLQAGAPRPEPTLPAESIIEASYETVYNSEDSPGIDAFRAATWLSEQMSALPTESRQQTFFWIGGGNAHPMAAMYSAHVARWLNAGWGANAGLGLIPDFEYAVQTEVVNVIAMMGTPEDIATMTATLSALRPGFDVLFVGVAPDKLATNVRIVEFRAPLTP